MKLFALPSLYRQGDIPRANLYESDIAALLWVAPVDSQTLLVELRAFLLESDLRELTRILAEIEARKQRFGGSDPDPATSGS